MHDGEDLKKIKLKIHGMHCASCEVLIERKFKKIEGIEKVRVNHYDGKAIVYCSQEPSVPALHDAVKSHGYAVSLWSDHALEPHIAPARNTKKDYVHIGGIFLIVVALYLILKRFELLPSLGIPDNMSYGFVFLIGLVAAVSTCMAVTGGLLVAVATKYNDRHPDQTGVQKFKPHLYFNIGRVVSYTAFGAAIGALGSMIALSARVTGVVTIIASLVMIVLGLQLLKLFPALSRFTPKMPKFIAHRIHDISATEHRAAPLFLGAGTFFLPCGFTQALQLYVLSRGDATVGALTMLAFSLGTMPALLSLGAFSSFAKGAFQKHFLKFAGVIVVLLGLFNVQNGLTLAGVNLPSLGGDASGIVQAAQDPNVSIVDGVQVVRMEVNGPGYSPNRFTIRQGMPVRWEISGVNTYGCQSVILAPKLGITKYVRQGLNIVEFTPTQAGEVPFHCSMAMYRGSFTVVASANGGAGGPPAEQENPARTLPCNPEIQACLTSQLLRMEISRERGFYPKTLTAKVNVPVELTIDDQVPLGGCMSVMVVPQYGVAQRIQLGENKLAFTPTRTGTVSITCSMGSKIAQIVVTD